MTVVQEQVAPMCKCDSADPASMEYEAVDASEPSAWRFVKKAFSLRFHDSLGLDLVVATASRLGLPVARGLPASVSVVTQGQIELRDARSAVEVIEAAVGIVNTQDGAQVSQGSEVALTFNPTAKWRVDAPILPIYVRRLRPTLNG